MLQFNSASARAVNPKRAVQECLEIALGADTSACDLLIINASIGHNLGEVVAQARAQCPRARIVACSCAGVVGREGVSETLRDIALMAVKGSEFAVAHIDDIHGDNAFDRAVALARALRAQSPNINMIHVLAPGIDIANDRVIAGFESVFGPEVTLFGATASDNMRGLVTWQAVDDRVFQHAAFAIGFADPTLEVFTAASHGFVATGEPMTVTRAEGNRILELDGRPAWTEYLARLGLDGEARLSDTIPVGALAEALPPAAAAEYGNTHILRVVTHVTPEGALVYPTLIDAGTRVWLTVRDEERIFDDMERLLAQLAANAAGRKPVAVFQADCLARGRRLFNRIIKGELVQRMQHPFSSDDAPPPWLGMYGFGEYARLDGVNAYHNYTTALAVLYRK